MELEERQTFEQAIALVKAGQKTQGYALFLSLVRHRTDDVQLLLWLVFTAPSIEIAHKMMEQALILEPINPNVVAAKNWLIAQEQKNLSKKDFQTATPVNLQTTPSDAAVSKIKYNNLEINAVNTQHSFSPSPPTDDNSISLPLVQNWSVQQLLSQLAVAEANSNWDEMVEAGEKILELETANSFALAKTAKAYFSRGCLCYEKGKYTEAIIEFSWAIQLVSNDKSYCYWRGRSYFHTQDFVKAQLDFEKALALDTKDSTNFTVKLYYWLGRTFYQLEDYNLALKNFIEAVALPQKRFSNALYYRGLTLLQMEDFEEASWDFESVLNKKPNFPQCYYWLGFCYFHLEYYNQAITKLTQAILLEDGQAKYFFWRGKCYEEVGEALLAETDLKIAQELDPDNFEYNPIEEADPKSDNPDDLYSPYLYQSSSSNTDNESSNVSNYNYVNYNSHFGHYKKFHEWLLSQPANIIEIPLTFQQIESIIELKLPYSAYNYPAWWSNTNLSLQAYRLAWLEADWRTKNIDVGNERVVFRRFFNSASNLKYGDYSFLYDWLLAQPITVSVLSVNFRQLKEILKRRLKVSECNYAAWWSNSSNKHSLAWLDAGWKTEMVDIATGTFTFRRVSRPGHFNSQATNLKSSRSEQYLEKYKRYKPLYHWLVNQAENINYLKISITEIDRMVGNCLPNSAYNYQAWWSNSTTTLNPYTMAWLDAGWKTGKVNINNGIIYFYRRVS